MQNALSIYQFDASPVRLVQRDHAPWFIAADVALVLGYRDAEKMTRMLDDDEADTHIVGTSGQRRDMTIISESGLYAAILRSRRPEAKRFRKWVTSEVLPAIRRTGGYGANQIDADRLMASVEAVREARETYGKAAAKRVWEQLGLPPAHATLDEGDRRIDPLVDTVLPWLAATPAPVSVDDVLDGLAIRQRGVMVRRRIGRILREAGRRSMVARRGDRVVRLYCATQPVLTREG